MPAGINPHAGHPLRLTRINAHPYHDLETDPETETENPMQVSEIKDYARQLYDELGPKAIATAAHRAREAEDSGNAGDAEKWRKIEEALIEMRGPHQS